MSICRIESILDLKEANSPNKIVLLLAFNGNVISFELDIIVLQKSKKISRYFQNIVKLFKKLLISILIKSASL